MNSLIERQIEHLNAYATNDILINDDSFTLRDKLRPYYRRAFKGVYDFQNPDVKLPDFLIVGCQKCGTSSLHHYLSNHPSVWSPGKKELHFFDYYDDLGLSYYKKFFKNQPSNIGDLLVGEATPEYIFHPYAAERIKQALPKAKAVVLLRNPIERAFSAWRMGIRQGWETLSFEDAIASEAERIIPDLNKMAISDHYYGYEWNHHSYLLRGHYAEQIDNWLLHFKREDLLIVSAERFFTNTKVEFKKVCDFLELDEWYPDEFQNMFVGVSNDLDFKTKTMLERYYLPFNKQLFEFLGEEYDW